MPLPVSSCPRFACLCVCSPYVDGDETHPEYDGLQDVQMSQQQKGKAMGAARMAGASSSMDIDDEQPGAAPPAVSAAASSASRRASGSAVAAASASSVASAAASASGTLSAKVPAPIFEIAWNGRIIPESHVVSLKWIDDACKNALAKCRYRLKGHSAAIAAGSSQLQSIG